MENLIKKQKLLNYSPRGVKPNEHVPKGHASWWLTYTLTEGVWGA